MADQQYDIVIVGSGLGGLLCAAILSKEGLRVCLIEKNEQIGGNLQTFKRDGVTFDTGVHYLGGLEKGQNLYKIFNYCGIMARLELAHMDKEGSDVVLFKNDATEYPYGMGYTNFIRVMTKLFPTEETNIKKYCSDIQKICRAIPMYNLDAKGVYPEAELFTRSAKQYFENLTSNEKLRNVLAGTNMLYAGVGNKTPLYVHALVVNSYIESAMKCTAGGDQIAKLLARVIKENNGDIFRKQKVTNFVVQNGEINHVLCHNNEKIYGKKFISNIPPATTLDMLQTDLIRNAYRHRIKSLENSVSVFVAYIVLKPNTWKCRNRNYYYSAQNDVWNNTEHTDANWPQCYAMFECAHGKNKAYAEGLAVMTYMRYDEVSKWQETTNTTLEESDRSEEYQQFKRQKAERLFNEIELKFPGFKDSVQAYYTSTPLSYRDYIGSYDGNMYGIAKDFNDPLKTTITSKTKIPNLLLTGQNVNLHGVLGVSISAVITCSMLLGKEYLVNKILAANAQTD